MRIKKVKRVKRAIRNDSQRLDFIIDDMAGMEAKMATKEDLHHMNMELYDEIIRAENAIEKNSETLKTLNTRYDILLLKADNTDLLLRLIKT